MISIEGGPFGITILVVILTGIGFGLFQAWQRWTRKRRHQAMVYQAEAISRFVAETRRVLDQDRKSVDRFVHGLGEALFNSFEGAPWLRDVTLHDLRNHVECATFSLVQGCPCGQCAGYSQGGAFWVEARRAPNGLHLAAYTAMKLIDQGVACSLGNADQARHQPLRTTVPPGQNVEMICADCGKPVVTSLDHIGQGKKPLCAACVQGGASRA